MQRIPSLIISKLQRLHQKMSKSGFKPYNLFQSALSKRYEELAYRHRNRCAHNTLSYQVNKPDSSVLASTDFSYHSYFFRFALIVLIDEIFMVLFREYVSLQN